MLFSIGTLRWRAHCSLVVLISVFTSACAAIHRPVTTVAALLTDADASRLAERRLRDTVVARLARRAVDRADHTVDILMLSGGGQNGAYGVGFLRGWRARTDAPMPAFDLITAISTGSVQAPFALMNTAPALDTLTEIYRSAADRIAPSLDWLFWLRRTGGLVNTKRFDATLTRVIDAPFRDSLRPAFSQGRQVVFGTTDLDIATGRAWDLQTSLGQDSTGLTNTRLLLKAATAIPGVFPPVLYEGHVHSDGGIVSNILTLLTLDDYKAMLARVRAAGVSTPVTVRLWVVVNGWTHAAPMIVNPASRKQIGTRWSNLMFYMGHPQTLQGLEYLAQAATAGVPGLSMQMQWTAIPAEVALDPASSSLFNKEWMQKLETLGTTRAVSAKPWDTIVSPYVRPAAVSPTTP
jgi:Patatin-like phospholipase